MRRFRVLVATTHLEALASLLKKPMKETQKKVVLTPLQALLQAVLFLSVLERHYLYPSPRQNKELLFVCLVQTLINFF